MARDCVATYAAAGKLPAIVDGFEQGRDRYAWGVFEAVAQQGRFVETFLVESWLEHLRQHERVTEADRKVQEQVDRFALGTPKVTHLIGAEPGRESQRL